MRYFVEKARYSRISLILWNTSSMPSSGKQDMDLLYCLAFHPSLLFRRVLGRERRQLLRPKIYHCQNSVPTKLRHAKPMCNDMVKENVPGLSHSRPTYNSLSYEQIVTQQNIINYLLALLINCTIHRKLTIVREDRELRENHTCKL